MHPAVVLPAAPSVKDNRCVVAMESGKHAQCIRQRVQVVDARHRCPSSHERTDQYIVASVSNRSALVAEMTIDPAGKKQT